MIKWLWYGNTVIIFLALLALVLGMSHLLALEPDGGATGDKSSQTTQFGSGAVTPEPGKKPQADSPLVAVTREFSERWMPPTGTLKIAIGPEQALAAKPQWRVSPRPWQGNGATLDNLAAGDHTVEFSDIDGWVKPENLTVTISRKQTAEASVIYQLPPPMGSLKVTLGPAPAVEAQAQWCLQNGPWQNSGATLDKTPVGAQVIEFKSLAFWDQPADVTIEITENQTSEVSAEYIKKPTGFLQVTLGPAEVLQANPQWRIGDSAWLNSGARSGEILTGSGTVEFTNVPKWDPPEKMTVNITQDQTTEVSAEYRKQPTGSLQVFLEPPQAVESGGQWRLDNDTWKGSGAVVNDILTGSHAVEYKPLTGWNTPQKITVAIEKDQTATVTYNYTKPKPPPPNFILEATLVIGQAQGLAWIKLPGKQKSQPVGVDDRIEQYQITRINNGSIELMREGFTYVLAVAELKAQGQIDPTNEKAQPSKPPELPPARPGPPKLPNAPPTRTLPRPQRPEK